MQLIASTTQRSLIIRNGTSGVKLTGLIHMVLSKPFTTLETMNQIGVGC